MLLMAKINGSPITEGERWRLSSLVYGEKERERQPNSFQLLDSECVCVCAGD